MKSALLNLFITLARTYYVCIRENAESADEAWREREWGAFAKHFVLVNLLVAGGTLLAFGLLYVVYINRYAIFRVLAPIGFIAVFIASWRANHPRNEAQAATEAPPPIDEVRARAERTFPVMRQTAYLLLNDLCRYLNGLVAPFSLAAVTAPVNFDVTVNHAVLYHFVIGKGNCDATTDTLKEILDSLIDQHLRARDLPLTVQAVYVSADGSTWPSLVVDGVYDLGKQYRVDLAITNEAVVSRLKARNISRFDDGAGVVEPKDTDFC